MNVCVYSNVIEEAMMMLNAEDRLCFFPLSSRLQSFFNTEHINELSRERKKTNLPNHWNQSWS